MTKEGRKYKGGKDSPFNMSCGENLIATCKRVKIQHFLTPYTKINSKWIKNLNIRPDTIKHLEENGGQTLYDINCSNIFPDSPPRVTTIKTNQWDLIKLTSFRTAKQILDKTKRQPTGWWKIFANDVTDKGLISKIYQYPLQLNTKQTNKQTNNPIKKWASNLNIPFSKEDIQMVKKPMIRCSTSLVIREMQTQTTMRYHLTPAQNGHRQNLYKLYVNAGEGVDKREPSSTVGGNINWCNHYGK